jgi:hypothetical protein
MQNLRLELIVEPDAALHLNRHAGLRDFTTASLSAHEEVPFMGLG